MRSFLGKRCRAEHNGSVQIEKFRGFARLRKEDILQRLKHHHGMPAARNGAFPIERNGVILRTADEIATRCQAVLATAVFALDADEPTDHRIEAFFAFVRKETDRLFIFCRRGRILADRAGRERHRRGGARVHPSCYDRIERYGRTGHWSSLRHTLRHCE